MILACSVSVAAMGMDQARPASAGIEVATTLEISDAWCKTLNGRPICLGEPD
jgi:hypothetical protein